MDLARQKGASSWLTAIPLSEHDFSLYKSAFRDALALRYGWMPAHMPLQCVCGTNFTVEHALNCSHGGLPSLRHNKIRDLTANLLAEVCCDVAVEPDLQPLTGESLQYRSAVTTDEARLDVCTLGFWGIWSARAYFDVKVFNPYAKSYRKRSLPSLYSSLEQLKRCAYEQRVCEIEHGSFTPLIFAATGGTGKAADVMYR